MLKMIIFAMVPMSISIFYAWRFASRKREIPCPFWLRWLVELDNPFTKPNKANEIIEQSGIQPGMHVIDLGCGPGRVTIPAAERVGFNGKITALDIQDEMLQRVEKKVQRRNLKNIEFVQGKIGLGQLRQSPCDHVLLVNVLGEIPDRQAALEEIFNILKPGGILTVAETIFDPHFQRREEVSKLADKAGFYEAGFNGNWAAYSLLLRKPVSR
ncbi:fibrillarin-like rRNA methylase [Oceanobacillus oncorhynchi subsp. incaldanensis]|uniref:class I SAM-dependent methyltransferase n=1 Tax=Oceanobacillus oncorhynchi TaxID=545501 RepID=UPI001B1A689C|nr:class I SAM-dependent methyltransferase [Oceanobacillus oncorhynchi]GIO17395.1 fibrillarin-like rRNA methylase [Oceanobacillus oncorhynchi subsp. incaldanensis]